MSDRAELLLTTLLVALCLVVASFTVLPRVFARDVAIEIEQPEVTVAVSGAVPAPGVYTLPFGSRVADAVKLAGGMTPEAEVSLVNLAATLSPGDRVHVPDRMTAREERRVSVNSASSEQLETLPGVGAVTARRIIDGRPYSRLEDLLRVKGIGEKTLERLRDHLRL